MIESNLKMTHNCVFFLAITGAFDEVEDKVSTIATITILTIIVLWPVFMTIFLFCKQKKLDNAKFKRKFVSMYNGVTKEKLALMYTSVFCVRRLLLVLALLLL